MERISEAYQLLSRLPRYWLLFIMILAAGLAEGVGLSALVPVVASLTGEVSGASLTPPFSYIPEALGMAGVEASFSIMLATTFLIMLIAFLLIHIQERMVYRARYDFLQELRDTAVKKLLSARWEYLSKQPSGSMSNVIHHEAERGTEAIVALLNMMAILVQLFVYMFFAALLSWQMLIIVLVMIVVAGFSALRLIKAVRNIGKRSVDRDTLFNQNLVDFFSGIKLLRSTSIESAAADILGKTNKNSCDSKFRIVINQSLMKFELQAFISLSMVAILYLAVEVLDIQVSVLLVFMFVIMRLAPKFSTFQGQYHNYSAFLPALERVDGLIAEAGMKNDVERYTELSSVHISGQIMFENVSYRYPEADKNSINQLTLSFNAGDYIALVGTSGSGKSTLVDLLVGLIKPGEGCIRVNNHDLSEVNLYEFRKKLAIVPQFNTFFMGTIRENLQFGIEHVTDGLVWNSLEIAQIDEYVRNLPRGLDSMLDEAGRNLSGGQQQRLAIARALIRKPELLILDEATSAIDNEAESRFQQAVRVIAKQCTTVVIAHKFSTIKDADKIFVINDGLLVEEGSYDELVECRGRFYQLLAAQLSA